MTECNGFLAQPKSDFTRVEAFSLLRNLWGPRLSSYFSRAPFTSSADQICSNFRNDVPRLCSRHPCGQARWLRFRWHWRLPQSFDTGPVTTQRQQFHETLGQCQAELDPKNVEDDTPGCCCFLFWYYHDHQYGEKKNGWFLTIKGWCPPSQKRWSRQIWRLHCQIAKDGKTMGKRFSSFLVNFSWNRSDATAKLNIHEYSTSTIRCAFKTAAGKRVDILKILTYQHAISEWHADVIHCFLNWQINTCNPDWCHSFSFDITGCYGMLVADCHKPRASRKWAGRASVFIWRESWAVGLSLVWLQALFGHSLQIWNDFRTTLSSQKHPGSSWTCSDHKTATYRK